MELLINSAHGIYIGQLLAQGYKDLILNKEELAEDLAILEQGPDNEEYIEAWVNVMTEAVLKDEYGNKYYLLENEGDVWAIAEGEELLEYFN